MTGTSLVELRVLDGPNLYFPRPAIKLTLDVAGLLGLPEEQAAAAAATRAGPPGGADSEQRRRFAIRLLAHLTRRVAAAAGVRSLAVRSRPGPEPTQVVVAYPWRRLHAAEALGRAVAELARRIDAPDLAERVEAAGAAVRGVEPGPAPSLPVPRIPTVAVTGTNGKTTVTRLIGHMGRCAGLHVGWSNTDGIYLDGELLEAGDWSGPGGAGRVLAQPVDVQSTLDRLARDQRNRDHRLRLVVRCAGDCLGSRIEMRLVHPHRLAVLDAPAGEPDTERTLVSEDLVRPFVARPDGGEHAPRLVGRVDRQRVVGNEICERIRNAVEQRIEALLGQDVMEDVREPAVRLDERSLTGRGGRRSSRLGNEAQRYRVIAHRRRPFGW